MTRSPGGSARAEVELARAMLDRLGVTVDQLLSDPATSQSIPTFDEYIDRVSEVVSDGTRRVYDTYWKRIREFWGNRRLNEPTPMEIRQLAERTRPTMIKRRNSRGGRTATEHFISAMRCIYRYAVVDGLITEPNNPALRVAKPRRLASTRRAVPDAQLVKIYEVAGRTGNDTELDLLLLRLHIETACRRGGALALRPRDLDSEQCLVYLREKGATARWQPVSPTLMRHLLIHAQQRGANHVDGQLLRYRSGRPITTRRYDYLWMRIGRHLPWVATQQVTMHWLRHTTLTWVERNFSYAVARAYAGHSGKRDAGTTVTYVQADLHEVACALACMTGESHPLAQSRSARARIANPHLGGLSVGQGLGES
jgi:integrase/recombinase XerC